MLSAEGKERSFASNVTLAIALSCVAGLVNAAGFFAVGAYTSHVTGNLSHAGEAYAYGEKSVAIATFALVAFFIAGAATASAMVEGAKRRRRARYATTLVLEAILLGAFTLGSVTMSAPGFIAHTALVGILCFAMGMQNALVTRISGAVIRTTHMTGIATDLGIELVAIIQWFRDRRRNGEPRGWFHLLRELPKRADFQKLGLHATIFLSFIVGAVGGPMLYLRHGQPAMVLPSLIIFALVGFDLLTTAWTRRSAARAPEAEPLEAAAQDVAEQRGT